MKLFPASRRKTLRKLVSVIAVAVLILLSVSRYFSQPVYAGTFQQAKVTISSSRAADTGVQYDFSVVPSVTDAIAQIDIYFCTTPSVDPAASCTAPPGLNTGTPTMSANGIDGSSETVGKISGQNNTITIGVGSTAPQTTSPMTMSFTGITNPTGPNVSYYARIFSYSDAGTTLIDAASMGMAVLDTDSISVTANVGSTFTFTVTGLTSADGNVNGEAITLDSTTDTTIPFGDLTQDTPSVAAHDITVTTNANNGYTVTLAADADPPLSDGSNNIDKYTGTNAAPTTWTGPTSQTLNTNTGFFGYTTEDSTLGTGTADRFTSSGGNKWAGPTTSPLEVAYSATGVSSETTRIGWQVEVDGWQPPGSYSGSMMLVATPTY